MTLRHAFSFKSTLTPTCVSCRRTGRTRAATLRTDVSRFPFLASFFKMTRPTEKLTLRHFRKEATKRPVSGERYLTHLRKRIDMIAFKVVSGTAVCADSAKNLLCEIHSFSVAFALILTGIHSCGGRIRTDDLWLMRPLCFRAAPPRNYKSTIGIKLASSGGGSCR